MGQSIKVTGTVAYRYINVIASFTDPVSNKLFIDTASVCVLPDIAYRVVIVGAADTIMTNSNKNTIYSVNLITMDSATDHDTVYAVTYDKYGNWTGKADNAVWTSLDTIAWIRNPPVGTQTGSWTLDPVTAGIDNLTVSSRTQTLTIPVNITVAVATK